MSRKYALIIGNTDYTDPGLAQLAAPGKDVENFARVLQAKEICAFDEVELVLNQPEHVVRGTIDEFFDQKKPDDLLVLYFSGHGVRDELGSLYLAVKNTIRTRLRSTAVKSDYIREAMDQSRSKRQVLILDCCNSGAFAQGTKAATGVSIGTASAFEAGYGRIILTASDSTQFAWEGDKVIGETDKSLFTHFLVEGLEGEADLDGDGQITVDELYDYAYEKVKLATPKQSPSKFSSKQQGEIILRQSIPLEDTKSVALPEPILDSIENPFPDIRLGAVQQLTKLLHSKNRGLARSAREALERMAENDDSRQVSIAATRALEFVRTQAGSPTIRLETGKAETEEVMPLSSRQALITLGWGIAGGIGGFMYDSYGEIVGGAVGGLIGGLVLITALGAKEAPSPRINRRWAILAWVIGGALGWFIGWTLTEAIGAGIGMAIFVTIGIAGTFGIDYLRSHWKASASIILAWFIGVAIGWSIAKGLIDEGGIANATGWTIGMCIAWAVGGFVMGTQLLNTNDKKAP